MRFVSFSDNLIKQQKEQDDESNKQRAAARLGCPALAWPREFEPLEATFSNVFGELVVMVAVPVVHLREGDAGGGPSKQGQNKAMEGECNEGMRRPARSSTPHKAEKKPHPSSAKARETELGSGHRLDVRKGKLTGVVVPNHGKEARVACPFPHELLKGRGQEKGASPAVAKMDDLHEGAKALIRISHAFK